MLRGLRATMRQEDQDGTARDEAEELDKFDPSRPYHPADYLSPDTRSKSFLFGLTRKRHR